MTLDSLNDMSLVNVPLVTQHNSHPRAQEQSPMHVHTCATAFAEAVP